MHTLGDTTFSGFLHSTPVKYLILWHPGARFCVRRESGINSHLNKLASERFLSRELNMSTSFDNADLNPTPMRRFRNTNSFNSPRIKELARHSRTNGSADNREALRNIQSGDFSSDVEILEPHASNLGRIAKVKESGQGGNGGCESIDLIMDFQFSLKISSLPVKGRMILDHHIMIGAVSFLFVTDLVGIIS